MRFAAGERRAKLATLMEIEGYDSIEHTSCSCSFRCGLSRHLHE